MLEVKHSAVEGAGVGRRGCATTTAFKEAAPGMITQATA